MQLVSDERGVSASGYAFIGAFGSEAGSPLHWMLALAAANL